MRRSPAAILVARGEAPLAFGRLDPPVLVGGGFILAGAAIIVLAS